MSIRKIAEPLTNEDLDVWDIIFSRRGKLRGHVGVFYAARDDDRRDADLMLKLTTARDALRGLKSTAQKFYDSLTPKERAIMQRLWGTRRPE